MMIFSESATWPNSKGRRGVIPEAQKELDKDSVHVSRPSCPCINNCQLFLGKREKKTHKLEKKRIRTLFYLDLKFTVGS